MTHLRQLVSRCGFRCFPVPPLCSPNRVLWHSLPSKYEASCSNFVTVGIVGSSIIGELCSHITVSVCSVSCTHCHRSTRRRVRTSSLWISLGVQLSVSCVHTLQFLFVVCHALIAIEVRSVFELRLCGYR